MKSNFVLIGVSPAINYISEVLILLKEYTHQFRLAQISSQAA